MAKHTASQRHGYVGLLMTDDSLSSCDRMLLERIDPHYAYQVTKTLVEMGQHKIAGTNREHLAAQWIESEMRKLGLKDVRREGFPVYVREISAGSSLTVLEPERMEIIATPMGCTYPTSESGVTGELVYVNHGLACEFPLDVRGKIVLSRRDWPDKGRDAYFRLRPVVEASIRGASAVVVFDDLAPVDALRTSIYALPTLRIPVIAIANRDARTLIESLQRGVKLIVKVKSCIDEPVPGVSYNVIGGLMGSKYADQFIIVASHYDTWWNGAVDSLSGIGCLLEMAKAMIEVGATPDRSILFIAHGAEEQGWPCSFDWLVGSYSNIFVNHADWPGKVLAELNMDVIGYRVEHCSVESTPELYPLIRGVASAIGMKPLSQFYSSSPSNIFTTVDSASYLFAGVPTADITFWPEEYWNYYHTAYDDMDLVTEESLLWTGKLWGITSLRLAQAGPAALSLHELGKALETELRNNAEKTNSSGVQGVDFSSSLDITNELKQTAQELELFADGRKNTPTARDDAHTVGQSILEGLVHFHRGIGLVGGADCTQAFYTSDPYAQDASNVACALAALRRGEAEKSIFHLEKVYSMSSGRKNSYSGYRYFLDEKFIPGTWAVTVQKYVDVYSEWKSLQNKRESGNTQFEEEIASLETKLGFVVSDLKSSLVTTNRTVYSTIRVLRRGLSFSSA